MKTLLKAALGAFVTAGLMTGIAYAAGLKDPKDVHITFVVHGSASDPYWSVVKRGVDDAAALTGAKVEYYAPQVFDVVEQARLLDAAIATAPSSAPRSMSAPFPNMIPARRPASGWPREAHSRSSASTTRSAMSASTSAARASMTG